jgi:cytochrome c2
MSKAILTTISLLLASAAFADDKAFNKCKSCHSIEKDGKNMTGPNLWNIMNRGVGVSENYKYSKAFSKWAKENPEWTPELMDQWLTNSKKLVKGTKMAFREKKEDKRAKIIEYLQSMVEVTSTE